MRDSDPTCAELRRLAVEERQLELMEDEARRCVVILAAFAKRLEAHDE